MLPAKWGQNQSSHLSEDSPHAPDSGEGLGGRYFLEVFRQIGARDQGLPWAQLSPEMVASSLPGPPPPHCLRLWSVVIVADFQVTLSPHCTRGVSASDPGLGVKALAGQLPFKACQASQCQSVTSS